MKTKLVILMVVLVSASLTLSAQADDEDGLVVFFRPKRFTGKALTPSVYVDGKQVARLDNGRFFSMKLPAGGHEIQSSMKHSILTIEVESGETIYLEMVILTGMWRGGGRLIPAPEEDARIRLRKLKPLGPKWIKDERVGFDGRSTNR